MTLLTKCKDKNECVYSDLQFLKFVNTEYEVCPLEMSYIFDIKNKNGGIMNKTVYFDIKLKEMNEHYQAMLTSLRLNNNMTHEALKEEIVHLFNVFQSEIEILKKTEQSSSKIAARLSKVQKDYLIKIKRILNEEPLKQKESLEKQIEKQALYAEYALDLVDYAMNQALLAVYCAVDLQMSYDERKEKNE